MSNRVFETLNHANLYEKFRPNLPNQVLDHVINYLNECIDPQKREIAVDVGCGSGQSTVALSQYFKQVYGFDISPAQLKGALESQHPNNVHFEISEAEELLSIKCNSTQLLTACVAAHWFDLEKFFTEVNRVLVRGGVVALIGYRLLEPFDPLNPNDQSLTNTILELRNDSIFDTYKKPNCNLIDNRYTDIVFPDCFEYSYKDNIINTIEMNAQHIIGFIKTLSQYQQLYKYKRCEAEMYISTFEHKWKSLLGISDLSQKKLFCNLRYFIAMGRKK